MGRILGRVIFCQECWRVAELLQTHCQSGASIMVGMFFFVVRDRG
jgi:hypothetical protein